MTDLLERPDTRAVVHGQGDMYDAIGCPIVVSVTDAYGAWKTLPATAILEGLTIRQGRTSVGTSLVEAGSASFEVIDRTGQYLATLLLLRRNVTIDASPAALAYWPPHDTRVPAPRLFTGRISEVHIRPSEAAGGGTIAQVVCTSLLAELGRTYVGDQPWPAEQDNLRMKRIVELAGHKWLNQGYNEGNLLARDVDRKLALDLIGEITEDTGSIFVEVAHTDQFMHVSSYDRGAAVLGGGASLYLDCDEILADWSASWTMNGLVNRWSIGYGTPPVDGEQPQALFEDAASIAAYGPITVSRSSQIASLGELQTNMSRRLPLYSTPRPELPDLTFDLWRTCNNTLTGRDWFSCDYTGLVAAARQPVRTLMVIRDLPRELPVNRQGQLWLEGITQVISRAGWAVTVSVSDPYRYGSALRWDDVAASVTWDSVPASVTWDNVDQWEGWAG